MIKKKIARKTSRAKKQKEFLKGIGASPGNVCGRVKIVKSPEGIDEINGKTIAVTSFLTPDFLAVVRRHNHILGIVTNKGGFTCHAAIVTRELKIPYIAGVMFATNKLKDDMTVRINGKTGIIYIAK